LSEPDFVGVKTGTTDAAGECLVSLNVRDGKEILTVIIGSNDRFGQTRNLIGWIFDHFSW
jgi:D-alanyl-D-alanine carboxypeptidase (penicillin-binding protein 5/6)